MNYLVTGGAGFIGSHLADKLLELGNSVTVVDDFSTGKERNLSQHNRNKNLKIQRRNICASLDEIFEKEGFDAVFHLAALARVQFSIKHPSLTHNVNVNGTFNLLNCCEKYNVKKVIFSSSSSVYGDQNILPFNEDMSPNPKSPYALHKLIGEEYSRLFFEIYRLKSVSLRYFNVYGPRQNPEGDYACLIPKLITMIANNRVPVINGDGEQTRDFTYVSDVVEANLAALESEEAVGYSFNIGSGKSTSVNEITKMLLDLSGSHIHPVHVNPVIEPRNTLAGIEKSREILRWSPKVTLEEGIKETYKFFTGN